VCNEAELCEIAVGPGKGSRGKKLLKVIIPDRSDYSSLLRKFSSDKVFMTGMRAKLEYKKR